MPRRGPEAPLLHEKQTPLHGVDLLSDPEEQLRDISQEIKDIQENLRGKKEHDPEKQVLQKKLKKLLELRSDLEPDKASDLEYADDLDIDLVIEPTSIDDLVHVASASFHTDEDYAREIVGTGKEFIPEEIRSVLEHLSIDEAVRAVKTLEAEKNPQAEMYKDTVRRLLLAVIPTQTGTKLPDYSDPLYLKLYRLHHALNVETIGKNIDLHYALDDLTNAPDFHHTATKLLARGVLSNDPTPLIDFIDNLSETEKRKFEGRNTSLKELRDFLVNARTESTLNATTDAEHRNKKEKNEVVDTFYREMAADIQAFRDDTEPLLIPRDLTERLRQLSRGEQMKLIRENIGRLKSSTTSRLFYQTLPHAELSDPDVSDEIKREYMALSQEDKKTFDELARAMLVDKESSQTQKDSAAKLLFIIRENDAKVQDIKSGVRTPLSPEAVQVPNVADARKKRKNSRNSDESSRARTVLTTRTIIEKSRESFRPDYDGMLDLDNLENVKRLLEIEKAMSGKPTFKEYIDAIETLCAIDPKKAAVLRETNIDLYYSIITSVQKALSSYWAPQLSQTAERKLNRFARERSNSLVRAHDALMQSHESHRQSMVETNEQDMPDKADARSETGREPTRIRPNSAEYVPMKDITFIARMTALSPREVTLVQGDRFLENALTKRANEIGNGRKTYLRLAVTDRANSLQIIVDQQSTHVGFRQKMKQLFTGEKSPEQQLLGVYKKILQKMT